MRAAVVVVVGQGLQVQRADERVAKLGVDTQIALTQPSEPLKEVTVAFATCKLPGVMMAAGAATVGGLGAIGRNVGAGGTRIAKKR